MVSTFHKGGVIDRCYCFFFLASKMLSQTANTKKKGKGNTIA